MYCLAALLLLFSLLSCFGKKDLQNVILFCYNLAAKNQNKTWGFITNKYQTFLGKMILCVDVTHTVNFCYLCSWLKSQIHEVIALDVRRCEWTHQVCHDDGIVHEGFASHAQCKLKSSGRLTCGQVKAMTLQEQILQFIFCVHYTTDLKTDRTRFHPFYYQTLYLSTSVLQILNAFLSKDVWLSEAAFIELWNK